MRTHWLTAMLLLGWLHSTAAQVQLTEVMSNLWGRNAGRMSAPQVRLTEVMFNPIGPENTDEFIEIYNASESDTVDLRGWRVGDQALQEPLVFPDSLWQLHPRQFAVILDPDYFADSNTYDDLIPADALLLTIDSKTFGSGGLSNSRPETVLLIDAAGDTVAAYTYTVGNAPGHSDEKIRIDGDDTPANWADSRVLHGTPGRKNSVSPLRWDAAIAFGPALTGLRRRMGEPVPLTVILRNDGIRTAHALNYQIVAGDSEWLGQGHLPALAPGESLTVAFEWTPSRAGMHELRAEVWLQDDERPENNRDTLSVAIGWPKQALVINEIMFNPEPGAPEWIELYNPGPLPISPAGWRIRDASGRTAVVAVAAEETMPPGGYAVIAADPSVRLAYAIPEDSPVWTAAPFPALNNRRETVALLDFAGFEIDSVVYALASSLPRNISLERVREDWPATDPQNWQASVDSAGATPGRFNSVSPLEFDAAVDGRGLTLSPNPATRQDWLQIRIPVRNIGRQPVRLTQASLWLAADDPYSPQTVADARELAQTLGVGEELLVTFEWQPPQSGRFAMRMEIEAANDARPHNNRFEFELPVGYVRGDAVINEIMARPEEGQPEWIEVINLLDAPVDLSGWRVADARTASGPVPENTWLAPGELLVLAQEPVAGLPEAAYRVLDDWPSLNNDRDRLMLLDFNSGVIDSLEYVAPASALAGVSLERIQPRLSGNDASNWSSSVDPAGNTPGRRNSVFVEWLPEASTLTVSPNPFSPDGDGREDFTLIRYDLPMVTGRVHLFVFDMSGRRVRQLLNNAPTGSQRTVIWDGRDDAGRVLPLGLYIVHLQAIDAGNGVLVNQTATVVLAKRW